MNARDASPDPAPERAERFALLSDLFTRCFLSAAAYALESRPFTVPEDADLLAALAAIRDRDPSHARQIADLVDGLDGVVHRGPFPYWRMDLNYLSVPCVAGSVLGAIRDDLDLLDRLLGGWPAGEDGRAVLEAIRRDKATTLDRLAALVDLAQERERRAYQEESDALGASLAAHAARRQAYEEARKVAEAEERKRKAAAAKAAKEAAARDELEAPAEERE